MLKNTASQYGAVSVAVHWIVALAVFGLFAVGVWMVDLTYYSSWYRTAPHWHKSVGLLLAAVLIFRLIWRFISPPPAALSTHKAWERKGAVVVQIMLFVLLFIMVVSGYLISTEDGRPIEVFDWFKVPSAGALFERQADIAGWVHEYAAYSLIALALCHAAAALKHHLIDKDNTLKRIFGRKS